MSAAACKLIVDSETQGLIVRIAKLSPAVARVVKESPEVWQISDLCASLMGKVNAALEKEGRRDKGRA